MYPLLLTPVFKEYLWGGEKLKSIYGKKSNLTNIAESWELACHKDGVNIIANGSLAGTPLDQYLKVNKHALGKGEELPLLVKFIDTAQSLSVQVHPNHEYCLKNEGQEGKIELWYIMDCEKDASLFYGFNQDLTKAEFEKHIKENTITQVLNSVSVKKGDVFVIDFGTVHAIGKNMTVAEIGTNCNVTYRIYDFGRKDAQGRERELHIKQALDVAVLKKQAEVAEGLNVYNCKEFFVEILNINGVVTQNATKDTFHNLLCTEGEGEILHNNNTYKLNEADSYFIPANMGEYQIKGNVKILKSTV